MSYNGSGVFVINTSGQPVVSGTVISSTAFNALTADLATGLTTALTKDGQTTPTANIKLGGYKLTGVGTGTASTDAANVGQVQSNAAQYITASGTDTITGTLTPSLTAYATGQVFTFKAAATNTGAVTLNIDGLGAKAVTKNGTTALIAGDIVSGSMITVAYNGTQFQIIGQVLSGTADRVSFFNSSAVPTTSASLTFNGTTFATPIVNASTSFTSPSVEASTTLLIRGQVGLGAGPSYGTAGQVLVSGGAGAAPTWSTASSPSMVLISTLTASASSFLEWTGLTTYDKYLLVYENVVGSSFPSVNVVVGTGAGPTYITSGYARAAMYVDMSTTTPTPAGTATSSGSSFYLQTNGSISYSGSSGQLLFTNFINAVGTRLSILGYEISQQDNSSSYYYVAYGGGGVTNASARTAIKVTMTSGNIASGKFSLYGITS